MAKTKEQKALEAQNETKTTVKETSKTGPSYDELLAVIQQLSAEVSALKAGKEGGIPSNSGDKTDKILEMLSNRKSDREVIIIHNCEMIGGLSTHLELTGLTIDFHTLGEQRLLSWQQFEECVSKYRSFFEKEIILLPDTEIELAARYTLPCMKRGDNKVLTHEDIIKLPTLEARALEDFVKSLTTADREFVFSYWLGKCYNKEPGFYDRYKIELLNNISAKRVFDNLLALMNGDFRSEETK